MSSHLTECLLSGSVAWVAALVFTFVVRALARRYGWVAAVRPDRWHRRPTALFGGVAIYAAFSLSYLLWRPATVAGDALLFGCATGLFAVGLLDDCVQLKPYAKLVGQIIFSTLFTTFGLRLHWLPWVVLDQALTIFWLVGITNAVNLLDNLDGLAGGVAAITAGYLVYFCQAAGQYAAARLAAAFGGAVLGFLVFNFNPASIFMGDCGSLFLGFFLGGVALTNNQVGMRRNVIAILTIPVLLLFIPILDTTLVTLSRKLHGRLISQGGRDHTSHRLVALGLSERAAALILWGFAAASGAMAVLVRNVSGAQAILIVPLFAMALLFLLIFLGRVRVYAPVDESNARPGSALVPTLANFGYKRRLFEVLNDLMLIVLAYYAAFLIRFDGVLVEPQFGQFLRSLPIMIMVQLGLFLAMGLYRGLWRYTSLDDLSRLVRAVFGGWVCSTLTVLFLFRMDGFSRGVFIIDAVLLVLSVASSRVSFRLLRSWIGRFRRVPNGRRVLIYGAGDGGELLLRELQNNHELGLLAIGFLDDDPQKEGRMIHGIPVLGSLARLRELVARAQIQEVVISTSKLAAERSREVVLACEGAGLNCRRMRIALEAARTERS